jgi:hypothetical protein
MRVWYRDEIGIVMVHLDYDCIQFLNGECYFSSNGEEYRINTENMIEIARI